MALGLLAGLIPSLITQFGGVAKTDAEKQQEALAAQMGEYAKARSDPNNPLYQNLFKQESQSGQQDLARMISELQGQNRMATRMGRTPLLDGGRGGETLFRGLMQSQSGIQDAARSRALSRLGDTSQGLAQTFSGYTNLAGQQDLRQRRNLAMELGAYGSIGDLLGGKKQQTEGNPSNLLAALAAQYQQPSYMRGLM